MLKSELVERFAVSHPHLRGADADAIVNTILECMCSALEQGDRIELRGFGMFSVKKRKARMGRNPRTGVSVAIADRKTLHFIPGRLNIDTRPMPLSD